MLCRSSIAWLILVESLVTISISGDEYGIDDDALLLLFPFSCQTRNDSALDFVNGSVFASLEYATTKLSHSKTRWKVENLCHKSPSKISITFRDFYDECLASNASTSVVVFGSFYSETTCEFVSLLGRLMQSAIESNLPLYLITWECPGDYSLNLNVSEMSTVISTKPKTSEAADALYSVLELFRMTGVRVISPTSCISHRMIAKELALLYSTAYNGKSSSSSIAELLFVSLAAGQNEELTSFFQHREYTGDARGLWNFVNANVDDVVLLMSQEETRNFLSAAGNETIVKPRLLLYGDEPLRTRQSTTSNDTWFLDVNFESDSISSRVLSRCIVLRMHSQRILAGDKDNVRTNASVQYSQYHEYAYNAVLLAGQIRALVRQESEDVYLMTGWTRLQNKRTVPVYYSLWAWVGDSNFRVVMEGLVGTKDDVLFVNDYVEILGNLLPKHLCNDRCVPDHTREIATSTTVILLLLVCASVVALYWIRRKMVFKELTRGKKKILIMPEDVVFVHNRLTNQSSASVTNNKTENKQANGFKSEGSLANAESKSRICRYNGDLIFMKELAVKNFQISSKLQNHLKLLQELRHENLNPFVGCFIDPQRPALLYEHCSRSSLADILYNEEFNLDWEFKISLLTDLIMGMKYIHGSSIAAHGNLKSQNCVIDTRWVLKITDFGVQTVYELCRSQYKIQKKEDLLWTAPEILRQGEFARHKTQKGDVYSFAIVMQEVILRVAPFSMLGKETEDVLSKILKPPPLCRPAVSPGAAPPEYIQLMKQCWAELPDSRPTFEEIASKIKAWNKGRKMNIVDAMFRKLEKYSNDLEEIVRVRTTALEEERKKTESLLTQMLPASVAQSLLSGNPVDPESYDEVTVYFSDIVGFTTISAMSSPLQVVRLLNDLYTMFDATIDNYDVYKVETIGDAYMACSGLPVKNGDRHAGEISTMALDLLSQCGQFQIWHMPDIPLRIRIGIHTGSCVAGVVGLRMPRFCLFGDTVNTASRMESTSTAFRIHVSWTTREKLVELGGYDIQYRGEVELKGKGKFKTYWLVGKAGFEKPLPEPPAMVGEDSHGLEAYIVKKASESS